MNEKTIEENSAVVIDLNDGEWVGSLDEFLSENGDAIEEEEAAEIRRVLAETGEYSDGGGAAAEWTIRLV